MSLFNHQLELLAPARDADIGIEAINHGADAVYIGPPAFGARAAAGNSVQDIERLCRHAHRFGAQIFITLNTILRDDELEAARRMAWDVYHAGADVLIVQDMGLLELDLPPIQLHASTQTDIRTPEKARFLQDTGFSQMVLARELTLQQIRAIREATDPQRCTLEFFIHGALCVAYSGQCFISHAHTGRSANRGNCSQECRLPYTVTDAQGRVIAHESHVLSLKDNDQSANLEALVDAGIRSFKIEGRYKDMGYVKNVTAHYRQLIDQMLERRTEFTRSSSGHSTFSFTPQPDRNFNRGGTDYFVNGRKDDIGAFDTPKHAGLPLGHVCRLGPNWFDLSVPDARTALSNGDGLTYFDLQRELVGVQANRVQAVTEAAKATAEAVEAGEGAESVEAAVWRVFPREAIAALKDLRLGTEVFRNRDMAWDRLMSGPTAQRRIGVWARLDDAPEGLCLTLTDEDGNVARATVACAHEPPRDAQRARQSLHDNLAKLGTTDYALRELTLATAQPWFVPASAINALRREAVRVLDAARDAAYQRPPRTAPVEPPVPYPDDTLSYLANVYNERARDFYARHGVKMIAAAYESQEELGDASLMITKHCVRFSLSLCPKQAKGVIGVQGTVRAEPLVLINGNERLTLRFDCKPCEMHVVGKMRPGVVQQRKREMAQATEAPLKFYRTRPVPAMAQD